MSAQAPAELLWRHEAFLARTPVDRPLLGYWLGGYYPTDQFPRGTARWTDGQRLLPADVRLEPFAPDYERLYRAHQEADDDFFYVGSPYWGIPWLEAILGCPVQAGATSARAEACPERVKERLGAAPDLDANLWCQALAAFTRELVALAAGRFPVCPPLLRGPGDAAAALIGGMAFVEQAVETPEQFAPLVAHCAAVRLAVLERLTLLLPAWHGTWAAGGYPSKIWSRRHVTYYQDDAAALLNPALYARYLLPPARHLAEVADVSFIHLHSACLYPLAALLEAPTFTVIEINVDHAGAGPPLRQLLPTCRRVQQAGWPLLLWGELSAADLKLLANELSPVGLSLQPFAPPARGSRHQRRR